MTVQKKLVTARPCFQGEVMMRKIDQLPEGLKPVPNGDRIVIAHSETGHDHVIDSRNAQLLIDATNKFVAYLRVTERCEQVHLRGHDTHDTAVYEPGFYELRYHAEETPEGWRRVED